MPPHVGRVAARPRARPAYLGLIHWPVLLKCDQPHDVSVEVVYQEIEPLGSSVEELERHWHAPWVARTAFLLDKLRLSSPENEPSSAFNNSEVLKEYPSPVEKSFGRSGWRQRT
jgi:hypothetical protein